MSTEPTSHPDTAYCIACDKPMQNGQPYYRDISGGEIHAECSGSDRESFTDMGGEPLAKGETIPEPLIWNEEPSAAEASHPDLPVSSEGVGPILAKLRIAAKVLQKQSLTADERCFDGLAIVKSAIADLTARAAISQATRSEPSK